MFMLAKMRKWSWQASGQNKHKGTRGERARHLHGACQAVMETLEVRQLLSVTWYVDNVTSHSTHDGTSQNTAFTTISQAVSAAAYGDTIMIKGNTVNPITTYGTTSFSDVGVYHETVTPTVDHLTFQAYAGTYPVVSGADIVSGWTLSSGNIYQASLNTTSTPANADAVGTVNSSWTWNGTLNGTIGSLGEDQVFINGKMVNEARSVNNTDANPSKPAFSTLTSSATVVKSTGTGYVQYVITDSSLAQSNTANYAKWVGGQMLMYSGPYSWVSGVGSIYDYTGTTTMGTITIRVQTGSVSSALIDYPPQGGLSGIYAQRFYLFGQKVALDSAGEWFHSISANAANGTAANTLYLWTSDSANLTSSSNIVYAKARSNAFNLANRSDITIDGINIFAAKIETNSSSNYDIFKNLSAYYVSQFNNDNIIKSGGFKAIQGPTSTEKAGAGIELQGNGDVLSNCIVAYSAADAVSVTGTNDSVTDCIIHDAGYLGGDYADINASFSTGAIITGNTVYGSARSPILVRSAKNSSIKYNDVSYGGLQGNDCGGIYTYGSNGGTMEIAYNIFHDVGASIPTSDPLHNNYCMTAWGIYLDNLSTSYLVDHNVTYDVVTGLSLNRSSVNVRAINNTLDAVSNTSGYTAFSVGTYTKYPNSVTLNGNGSYTVNADGKISMSGTVLQNNIFLASISPITTPTSGNKTFGTGTDAASVPKRLLDGSDGTPGSLGNAQLNSNGGPSAVNAANITSGTTPGLVDRTHRIYQLTSSAYALDKGTAFYDSITGKYVTAVTSGSTDDGAYEGGLWYVGVAPTSLTPTVISPTQINLTWSYLDSTETGFKIQRATNSTFTTGLQNFTSSSASFSDTGLTANTTYYYRVQFDDGSGSSTLAGNTKFSATASATTTPSLPAAPSGLALTVISSSQINLTWTDNSSNETGFKVDRATDSGFTQNLTTITTAANASSYSSTGLNAGTTYYFRVRATNASGDSANTSTANATTLPAAPSGLSPTVISSSQINLTWTDNSSNETGFKVDRATDAGFTQNLTTNTTAANATSYSSTGLNGGTTYYYRVRASSASGDSDNSNVVYATTNAPLPAAPSGLALTVISSSQINLTWTDNSNNETGFKVDRATDSGFTQNLTTNTTAANATSYSSTGLAAGTTYYYRVRATNASGDSANTSTLNAITISAAPTGLAAAAAPTQATLTWSATTGASSYNIYRSTSSGGEGSTVYATSATTSYTDTGLTNTTTYYYKVAAVNAGGTGAQSSEASAQPLVYTSLDINAVLTGSTSYNTSTGTYTIQAGGADIWGTSDGFRFAYQTWTGDGQIVARVTSLTGISGSYTKGGVMIRNSLDANAQSAFMVIQYPNNVTNVADLLYRTTTGGSTSYTGSGSASITTPEWVKLVRSGNSFSGYYSADGVTWTLSSTQTIAMNSTTYIGMAYTGKSTTTLGTATFDNVSIATLAPVAPSNLSLAVVSTSQINLTWTDNSSTETGFKVDRATDSGFTQNLTTVTTAANATSYNSTGLTAGTTYYYRVRATNGSGDSANTSTQNAITIPAAPTGLTAAAVPTQVTLNWSATTGASSYNIYRSTTTGGEGTTVYATSATTSFTDTGLTNTTTYYYKVAAVNASGTGAQSSEASAQPLDYTSLDISTGVTGSTSYDPATGTYTIQGGGANIWSTSDGFRFLYQTWTGDAQIVARITSLSAVGGNYTKGGVMIRNSLAANDQSVSMVVQYPNDNTAAFLYRSVANGATGYVNTSITAAPYWVKLTRSGDTFNGYSSPDGITWTLDATQTIAMNSTIYLGLAYCSRSTTTLGTGVFDNVGVGPIAPTSLAATVISSSQVNLNWTDNSTNETGFEIDRATNSTFSQNVTTTTFVGPGANSYQDTTVDPSATYYYRIRAINDLGDSTNSNTASVTTLPEIPSGLTAIPGNAQIALTWTASTGATTYNIYRSTTTGNEGTTVYATSATPSYTDTSLTNGTTYYYTISAVGPGGTTDQSDEISATPTSGYTTDIFAQHGDVGSPNPAGSVSFDSATGTYSVVGAGSDIWGSADQFHYKYHNSTGDGALIAAVTGLTNTNSTAKAAIMFRSSAAANAAYVLLDVKPAGGLEFNYRATDGGSSVYAAGVNALGTPSSSNPIWLKVVKSGSSYTAYYATGTAYPTTWTSIATVTANGINSANYLTGLAVCSRVNGTPATGLFTNVSDSTTLLNRFSNLVETSPSTPAAIQSNLQTGAKEYTDRTYTYTNMVSSGSTYDFTGADYIQTANSDKAVANYSLTYTLTQNAYVYILIYKYNLPTLPTGMSGFTDTGETLTNGTYEIFRAYQTAGTYTIGSEVNGNNFYTILAMSV